MLRLSRKADYALISLGYLAEREGRVSSAREIAAACQIPVALLMNILKSLHHQGVLKSVRGATGGYRIGIDLHAVSLLDLCRMVEQVNSERTEKLALHGPAQALQYRIGRFMREVSVADLVLPGRRIDVPLERVRVRREYEAPALQTTNVA